MGTNSGVFTEGLVLRGRAVGGRTLDPRGASVLGGLILRRGRPLSQGAKRGRPLYPKEGEVMGMMYVCCSPPTHSQLGGGDAPRRRPRDHHAA